MAKLIFRYGVMESSKTANHLVKIQCLQRASTNALPPIAAFLIADSGKTHEENVKTLKESMLWLQYPCGSYMFI